MYNLPEGIYSWELDVPEHFAECNDQPEGYDCICEEIKLRKIEDEQEAIMEFERGN